MAFTFRPATREHVGLLIGLSGASGSGKTFTAMRLAHGIVGTKPFAVIDTEAGRAKHYADRFQFDHGDLTPPFTPERYAEAIEAADKQGYGAIVVDSTSHEWAGDGGILDLQEHELHRMAGDDWKKRESCKMAAWIKPKMSHKRMVQKLLQVRAHLILCFRAEPKIEMVRGEGGRMEIREKQSLTGLHGGIPVCEKTLPYELTASFLLMPDKPGVPMPIKLQEQHRALFPLDKPITEDSGRALAAWAHGGVTSAIDALPQWLPPDPSVIDWAQRIAAASTKNALRGLNADLKAAKRTMAPPLIETLRQAYEARVAELSATQQTEHTTEPLTAADIPFGGQK